MVLDVCKATDCPDIVLKRALREIATRFFFFSLY